MGPGKAGMGSRELIRGKEMCLLTSSSFSRINFSVSARGSMGSGISVALCRESLLEVEGGGSENKDGV